MLYNPSMLKSVKMEEKPYKDMKAYADKRGLKLQHVLSEAVRAYLKHQSSPKAA